MVEKRIIKNINNSIPSSNKYKNIETKLDFNGFQSGSTPKAKTRTSLKLIIPISVICAALVVAAIVVPVTLSKQNEQMVLNPISDEMMSFYLKNTFSGDSELPEGTSVGGLYNTYKEHHEEMAELASNKEIFNLTAENKFHCYYVTKEVLKCLEQTFIAEPDDYMLPWRGLTIYCHAYSYLLTNFENVQLMEVEINADVSEIKTRINKFYLLDVVQYFSDLSIDNYYWIDFVDYDVKNGTVFFDNNETKNNIKCLSCTLVNPNKLREKEMLLYNYSYLCLLDYHSFEITQEDDIEIVNETFRYIHIENPHYYDELNDCIIRKTFVDSYANRDAYDVTFAYQKLVKLFGF